MTCDEDDDESIETNNELGEELDVRNHHQQHLTKSTTVEKMKDCLLPSFKLIYKNIWHFFLILFLLMTKDLWFKNYTGQQKKNRFKTSKLKKH